MIEISDTRIAIAHVLQGYETRIDPTSEQISLGQRQRIGLARALYGDPALVVLDEPNSNLDRAGEVGLHNAIRALSEAGTSVVVVSHRASILKLADLVMSLKEGRIEQFGALEQCWWSAVSRSLCQ